MCVGVVWQLAGTVYEQLKLSAKSVSFMRRLDHRLTELMNVLEVCALCVYDTVSKCANALSASSIAGC